MDAATTQSIGLTRQAWNFVRHFLEMCVAMCAGGGVLALVIFAGIPALTGSASLRELYPEVSLFVIAAVLTVPMALWMSFRGMAWRPIVEMSAVAVALAAALVGSVWAGLTPRSTLQVEFGLFCGLACVGMFVTMLFRLDEYTGRRGGHHSPPARRRPLPVGGAR